MKFGLFLLAAVAIAGASFLLLGAWLLPMLGVERGMVQQAIPGGVAGGLIAWLYVAKVKGPDRA